MILANAIERINVMRVDQIPVEILPSNYALYYGGNWNEPKLGGYSDTINPAYNEPICQVPVATAEDVHAAVTAAHNAFPEWASVTPTNRGKMLREAASILRQYAWELA